MTKKISNFFLNKNFIIIVFVLCLILSLGSKGCEEDFALPMIQSITPNCSDEHGDIEVTIQGQNLSDDIVRQVNFGDITITDIRLTHGPYGKYDFIRFKNPPGTPGSTVEVTVPIPVETGKIEFSYKAYPDITAIIPASGSTEGGTEVRIVGNNFTSPCTAELGGSSIDELIVESSTSIIGVTTAHEPGFVNLVLTSTPEYCPARDILQGFEYFGEGGVPEIGTTIPIGGNRQYVAIGDITNDLQNDNDIVVASYDETTGAAYIVTIDGATYEETIITLPTGSSPRGITLTDFDPANGNGLDLAVALEGPDEVAILINNGSGYNTSTPILAIEVGNGPFGITHGDFDMDGLSDDLATPNYSGASFSVIIGNDDGTFSSPSSNFPVSPTSTPIAITTGDFYGNDIIDIGVVSSVTNEVSVFYNTTSGSSISFHHEILSDEDEPLSVIGADFNGDGLDDIATVNKSSTLSYRYQDNGGGFGSLQYKTVGENPFVMASGNFGTNGWLVIGYRGTDTYPNLFDLRDGLDRTGLYQLISTADGLILSIASGDLDNDGIDDLVFGMEDGGSIVIVLSSDY